MITDSKRQMGLYRKHDAPFPTAIKGLTELTYHWTKTYPCKCHRKCCHSNWSEVQNLRVHVYRRQGLKGEILE